MAVSAADEGIEGWRGFGALGRLRDRLAASDPAFSRLRLASRGMLSLLLSLALLGGIYALHPLPVAAFGLAVVLSFNGSLAVRDKTAAGQAETRALAWVAAIASVLAASLLAPWPLWADAVFLAVIFLAVYARRFGPRGLAVGMMAFMAFFMGDYLKPAPADIGWLALAAAVALAVTQLVTTVILRDDPERDFRRALTTIDQRIDAILKTLGEGTPVDRRVTQKQLSRLTDVLMMAEGFIPQGSDGSLAARGAASDLAVALFDLQLAVERLVRSSWSAPPAPELVAALRSGRTVPDDAGGVAGILLARLQRIQRKLAEILAARPSPAFAAEPAGPLAAVKTPAPAGGKQPLIAPEWRAPIQVTLACFVAMGLGELTAPSRWYWAVITAFIVFNNTRSRADTAVRGLQRSAGTLAGLVGGTLLATLVHGQPAASIAGIFVLFFLAFYYLQASYSLMIFFITLALALLYGLMGSFSPELLLVRLEETVIGAAAGTLVAFVVFPSRTSQSTGAALEKYLAALGDVVQAARGRVFGASEPLHLLARSRLLDRAYADLAVAVRPIGGPWGAVTRFGEVRERLLLLTGVAHWARALARSLPSGVALPDELKSRVELLDAEIGTRIAAARAAKADFFERPQVGADEISPLAPRPPVPIAEETDPVVALEVISALLGRATPTPARPG